MNFARHEDTFIRKDGSFFPVVLQCVSVEKEGTAIGIGGRISRRHAAPQAERAVRESEERFRLMADTAPVIVWTVGPDRLATYFNRPGLEFTGQPLEAQLGNGWVEGVHPDDVTRGMETYIQAFDRRLPFKLEYRLRRHDGEYRWMMGCGAPIFLSDGSFAGYVGSAIDVTDLRLAREALSNLSRSLMEAQEKERAWIARELHDDLGQRIAALAMQLHGCAQALPSGTSEQLSVQEAFEETAALAQDIQSISRRLHSVRTRLSRPWAGARESLPGTIRAAPGGDRLQPFRYSGQSVEGRRALSVPRFAGSLEQCHQTCRSASLQGDAARDPGGNSTGSNRRWERL